jgi:hypothetical protein
MKIRKFNESLDDSLIEYIEECFVEFLTKQDKDGEWRVEDILVRSNYEGDGLGRTRALCEDLAREASK